MLAHSSKPHREAVSASYRQGLARPDRTDKTGLSAEAQPPGVMGALRIRLCYSRSYRLDNCHEHVVAVLA